MKSMILWTGDRTSYLKKDIETLLRDAATKHRIISLNDQIPVAEAGDLIIAMGTGALKILQDNRIVPKGRTVTSQRNYLFPLPSGAFVLVTYSAEIFDSDYAMYVDMVTDINKGIRYVNTGSIEPVLGTYRYVNDFTAAKKWIEARYKATGKKVPVAIDTETLGLDRYHQLAYIVSIQITYKPGTADMVRFENKKECKRFNGNPLLKEHINWLLTSPMVALRAANFKYDINWMHEMWNVQECTNFGMDTMLVGSLLDENRSNSLKLHTKIYVPSLGGYSDTFDRKYDKGRMDLVPPEELLLYGGGDTDACLQVSEKQKIILLKDKQLTTFYNTILHPAARAYEHVERVGWSVNWEYYEFLAEELQIEIEQLEWQMKKLIGGRIVGKHLDKNGHLNMAKAAMLKDFMFSPMGLKLKPKMWTAGSYDENRKLKPNPEPSTSYDHLVMFEADPKAKEFVAMLKQYMSATKTYQTYVVGFLASRKRDGKFHPTFFMHSGFDEWGDSEHGTVTGRLSVIDPAIQTLPKHTAWAKRLRYAFIAPPGMLILANDYSQGELKIMACEANEHTMLESYMKGIDLHAVTGAKLTNMKLEDFLSLATTAPDDYEYKRFLAKSANFGLIYGMGAEGFKVYAEVNYGVKMTLEEAEIARDAFFDLYPELIKYHERQKYAAQTLGYVRSPLGRVRRVPLIRSQNRKYSSKAVRQAINSPIQATLSDMALWSAAIMWKQGMLKKAPVFGMIHDQNLRYIPEDNSDKYMSQSKEIMENLPFHEVGWEPALKFTVDSEVGKNLGELDKMAMLSNGTWVTAKSLKKAA